MFCHKCGTQIDEGASFCHKCGTKVIYPDSVQPSSGGEPIQENTATDTPIQTDAPASPPDTGAAAPDPPEDSQSRENAQTQTTEGPSRQQVPQSTVTTADEPPAQSGPSKFRLWWNGCSKPKKALVVAGILAAAILALAFLVSFLREFGALLFGILVIVSFLIAIFHGSKEEKQEARKTLVQLIVGSVLICVVAIFAVTHLDTISDIFQPGASVRNAYMTEYSESVTVEEAFDDYFADGQWNTYKDKGDPYVVFTGTCELLGVPVDVKLTFKITGKHFTIDRLEVNGVEQNDFMLYRLLESVYEDE